MLDTPNIKKLIFAAIFAARQFPPGSIGPPSGGPAVCAHERRTQDRGDHTQISPAGIPRVGMCCGLGDMDIVCILCLHFRDCVLILLSALKSKPF